MKIKNIYHSVIISVLFLFKTFSCCAGEITSVEQSFSTNKSAEFLKSQEMKESLSRNLNAVEIAKGEIAEFQEEVKGGKIKVENNNGIWCAVSDKKEKIVRLANYASQNGPMGFFTKRVYSGVNSDSTHSNEVHALGYDIYFYTNGQIKTYLRRDWVEGLQYFEDGQINTFHIKKPEGQYIASWDTNGCLIQEGISKGLIEKKKGTH